MKRSDWFIFPVFTLIFSTAALGVSLFLYIYWYLETSTLLKSFAGRLNLSPDKFREPQTWIVILVLSILVVLIFIGIFTIFVFSRKIFQLYRLQNNFINNFTHELKTPVTSLKLYLETFKKYDLPRKERLKYIDFMIRDVERLSDNVLRILDLAKIESKSYLAEYVKKDLYCYTKKFVEHNAHHFKHLDITMKNRGDSEKIAYISPPLFDMMLMNLLTNASKYNRSEKPIVEIVFENMKHRQYIHFKDNGIGIEKKDLKRIFRKFYQVGDSENMSAKGSGLGLYLVTSIVKLHKGKVTVKSRGKDCGTNFTIRL